MLFIFFYSLLFSVIVCFKRTEQFQDCFKSCLKSEIGNTEYLVLFEDIL